MTTDPQTFRHRAEEVEAVQWTGDNADALRAFAGPDFDEIDLDDRTEDPDETAAVRESEHGTWRGLKPGDWVVRLDGGLYEFAADDFAKQYEPAPAAPVAAPPTGQAGLVKRVAAALTEHGMVHLNDPALTNEYDCCAEAALAVLPAPVDRGAYLLAVDAIERMQGYPRLVLPEEIVGELRRLAAETPSDCPGYETSPNRCACPCEGCRHNCAAHQAAETPGPETQDAACGPAPDVCDAATGEPCDDHERRQAHADGEHAFCGTECAHACTCGSAGDAFVPLGHYRDCPAAAAEPHPTEADLRHALNVAAKFHGQAAATPAVVAEPGKEA